MKETILIAPHNDDETLFAYKMMSVLKPRLVVATDSYIQFKRGQTEITAERRRAETMAAASIYGVPVDFLGIPDDEVTFERLCEKFEAYRFPNLVLVPALQLGNETHDLVYLAAVGCFRVSHVLCYATYAKGESFTPRGCEVYLTGEDHMKKSEIMACYLSQSWQSHFVAVRGKNEYICVP